MGRLAVAMQLLGLSAATAWRDAPTCLSLAVVTIGPGGGAPWAAAAAGGGGGAPGGAAAASAVPVGTCLAATVAVNCTCAACAAPPAPLWLRASLAPPAEAARLGPARAQPVPAAPPLRLWARAGAAAAAVAAATPAAAQAALAALRSGQELEVCGLSGLGGAGCARARVRAWLPPPAAGAGGSGGGGGNGSSVGGAVAVAVAQLESALYACDLNDVPAALLAPATLAPVVAGAARFACLLPHVATTVQQLHFEVEGWGGRGWVQSAPFAVLPGPPARLRVVRRGALGWAGNIPLLRQPVVEVVDAGGNALRGLSEGYVLASLRVVMPLQLPVCDVPAPGYNGTGAAAEAPPPPPPPPPPPVLLGELVAAVSGGRAEWRDLGVSQAWPLLVGTAADARLDLAFAYMPLAGAVAGSAARGVQRGLRVAASAEWALATAAPAGARAGHAVSATNSLLAVAAPYEEAPRPAVVLVHASAQADAFTGEVQVLRLGTGAPSASEAATEIQRVMCMAVLGASGAPCSKPASAGSYVLTWHGMTTRPIPAAAHADYVQAVFAADVLETSAGGWRATVQAASPAEVAGSALPLVDWLIALEPPAGGATDSSSQPPLTADASQLDLPPACVAVCRTSRWLSGGGEQAVLPTLTGAFRLGVGVGAGRGGGGACGGDALAATTSVAGAAASAAATAAAITAGASFSRPLPANVSAADLSIALLEDLALPVGLLVSELTLPLAEDDSEEDGLSGTTTSRAFVLAFPPLAHHIPTLLPDAAGLIYGEAMGAFVSVATRLESQAPLHGALRLRLQAPACAHAAGGGGPRQRAAQVFASTGFININASGDELAAALAAAAVPRLLVSVSARRLADDEAARLLPPPLAAQPAAAAGALSQVAWLVTFLPRPLASIDLAYLSLRDLADGGGSGLAAPACGGARDEAAEEPARALELVAMTRGLRACSGDAALSCADEEQWLHGTRAAVTVLRAQRPPVLATGGGMPASVLPLPLQGAARRRHAGAVYLFQRSRGAASNGSMLQLRPEWAGTQRLQPPHVDALDLFGYSVALSEHASAPGAAQVDGGTLCIGAPGSRTGALEADGSGGAAAGVAYVYEGASDCVGDAPWTWRLAAPPLAAPPTDRQPGQAFGWSTAAAASAAGGMASSVVIGAPGTRRVTASSPPVQGGTAVAGGGGSPGAPGAVYVYTVVRSTPPCDAAGNSPSTVPDWAAVTPQVLTPAGVRLVEAWAGCAAAPPLRFGEAVALAAEGDSLAVGAPGARCGRGLVFLFKRQPAPDALFLIDQVLAPFDGAILPTQLPEAALLPRPAMRMVANAASIGAAFGAAVAFAASTLAIGAPGDACDLPSCKLLGERTGAVYLFERSGWAEPGGYAAAVHKLIPVGAVAGDRIGWSVAVTDDKLAVAALPAVAAHSPGSGVPAVTASAPWAPRDILLDADALPTGRSSGGPVHVLTVMQALDLASAEHVATGVACCAPDHAVALRLGGFFSLRWRRRLVTTVSTHTLAASPVLSAAADMDLLPLGRRERAAPPLWAPPLQVDTNGDDGSVARDSPSTRPLAWNVSSADLAAALQADLGMGLVRVTRLPLQRAVGGCTGGASNNATQPDIIGHQWLITMPSEGDDEASDRLPLEIDAANIRAVWACGPAEPALLLRVDDSLVAAAASPTAGSEMSSHPHSLRLTLAGNSSSAIICTSAANVFADGAVVPAPSLPAAAAASRVWVYTRDAASAAPSAALGDDDSGLATGLEDFAAVAGAPPPPADTDVSVSVVHGVHWTAQAVLAPHSHEVGDNYGYAVALPPGGRHCIVGAPARAQQGYDVDGSSGNSDSDGAVAAAAVADGRARGAAIVTDLTLLAAQLADPDGVLPLAGLSASSLSATTLDGDAVLLPDGSSLALLPGMAVTAALSGNASPTDASGLLAYALTAEGDDWGAAALLQPARDVRSSNEVPARGQSLLAGAAELQVVIAMDRPLSPLVRLSALDALSIQNGQASLSASSMHRHASLQPAIYSVATAQNCSGDGNSSSSCRLLLAHASARLALAHAAWCCGDAAAVAQGSTAAAMLARATAPLALSLGQSPDFLSLSPTPVMASGGSPAIVLIARLAQPTDALLHLRLTLPGLYALPGGGLWRSQRILAASPQPSRSLTWIRAPSSATRASLLHSGRAVALAGGWAFVGSPTTNIVLVFKQLWAMAQEVPAPPPVQMHSAQFGASVAAHMLESDSGGEAAALAAVGVPGVPAIVLLRCNSAAIPACAPDALVVAPPSLPGDAPARAAVLPVGTDYYRAPAVGDGFGARGAIALASDGAAGGTLAVGCAGLEAVFLFRSLRVADAGAPWPLTLILRAASFATTLPLSLPVAMPHRSAAAGFGTTVALTSAGMLAVGAPHASATTYAQVCYSDNNTDRGAPAFDHNRPATAVTPGAGAVVVFQRVVGHSVAGILAGLADNARSRLASDVAASSDVWARAIGWAYGDTVTHAVLCRLLQAETGNCSNIAVDGGCSSLPALPYNTSLAAALAAGVSGHGAVFDDALVGDGLWVQQAVLTVPGGGQPGDGLGLALAASGASIIAGAPFASPLHPPQAAAAWGFEVGSMRSWAASGDAFAGEVPTPATVLPCGSGLSSAAVAAASAAVLPPPPLLRNSPPCGRFYIDSRFAAAVRARDAGADSGVGADSDGGYATGSLTSQPFLVTSAEVSFLIGGGCDVRALSVTLLIDGMPVLRATGDCTPGMRRVVWPLARAWQGRTAVLQIIDEARGGGAGEWAHLVVDDFFVSPSGGSGAVAASDLPAAGAAIVFTRRMQAAPLAPVCGDAAPHVLACSWQGSAAKLQPADARAGLLFGAAVAIDEAAGAVLVSAAGGCDAVASTSALPPLLPDWLRDAIPWLRRLTARESIAPATSQDDDLLVVAAASAPTAVRAAAAAAAATVGTVAQRRASAATAARSGGVATYLFRAEPEVAATVCASTWDDESPPVRSSVCSGAAARQRAWLPLEVGVLELPGSGSSGPALALALDGGTALLGWLPAEQSGGGGGGGGGGGAVAALLDVAAAWTSFTPPPATEPSTQTVGASDEAAVVTSNDAPNDLILVPLHRWQLPPALSQQHVSAVAWATVDGTAVGVDAAAAAACCALPSAARALSVQCAAATGGSGDYVRARGVVSFAAGQAQAGNISLRLVPRACRRLAAGPPRARSLELRLFIPGGVAMHGAAYAARVRIDSGGEELI